MHMECWTMWAHKTVEFLPSVTTSKLRGKIEPWAQGTYKLLCHLWEGLETTCVNQHGVKEEVYVIRGYVKGCNHIHPWAGKH
jgi:hypothetical protein